MTDLDVQPAPAITAVPPPPPGSPTVVTVGAALLGAAVIALTPLWFTPFAIGAALGAGTAWRGYRARSAVLSTMLAALIGSALPLVWRSLTGEPVLATAGVIAALAGLPRQGSIIIMVLLAVAAGQSMLGVWLARALWTVLSPGTDRPAPAPESSSAGSEP